MALLFLHGDLHLDAHTVLSWWSWDPFTVMLLALSGGLYNMSLTGTGWVAILSDGPPVLLNVASAPTFADAQAAITWSQGVSTALKTDFKMKNLIGRGSGETFQMAFSGQGWVLVQPSEGRVQLVTPQSSASGGLGSLLNS